MVPTKEVEELDESEEATGVQTVEAEEYLSLEQGV